MNGSNFLANNKGFFKLPYLYIKYRWKLKIKPIDLMVLEELMFTQRDAFRYCHKTLAKTLGVSLNTLEKSIYRLSKVYQLIKNVANKGEIAKWDFTPLIIRLDYLSQDDTRTIKVEEVKETKELSAIMSSNEEYFGKWCDRELQVKEYQATVENVWNDMNKEAEETKVIFQAASVEEKKVEWNEYFEKEIDKALYRNFRHLTPKGETPLEKAKWCLKEDYKDRKGAALNMVKLDYYGNISSEEFEKMLYENKLEEFRLLAGNTKFDNNDWVITVYIGGDIPIEMNLLEYTGMNEKDFNLFKEIYNEQSPQS